MKYEDPACAYCPPTVRACRQGEADARGPGYCPTKVDPDTQNTARALYADPETQRISQESARVEAEIGASQPRSQRDGHESILPD